MMDIQDLQSLDLVICDFERAPMKLSIHLLFVLRPIMVKYAAVLGKRYHCAKRHQ